MRALLAAAVTCLLVGACMTGVLLAWGESNKPDLVVYDVQFLLVQATDPLSDTMIEEWRRSTQPSDPRLRQLVGEIAKNTQRSHEAGPRQWNYWFTCYMKNRGKKDALRINVKVTPPPNTINNDSRALLKATLNPKSPDYWDAFYIISDDHSVLVLDYLKSGEVKRVTGAFCWGRFHREPSPELVGKLKGTRLEIGSFESEP